jgi:hypothetical protein
VLQELVISRLRFARQLALQQCCACAHPQADRCCLTKASLDFLCSLSSHGKGAELPGRLDCHCDQCSTQEPARDLI